MSCFCLTCLPCLKSPCQLEGEALPTWRFTARRYLRSAASQERLRLSGMLEERSSGVACDYGLHLGLLKTLGIKSRRYPTYPKERGPTVI
jgi:hypothetical protein